MRKDFEMQTTIRITYTRCCRLSCLFLVSLLLSACRPSVPVPTAVPSPPPTPAPEPIELVDGLGRSVRLEKPAQRILSLAPSNTEILYAVGAGSQVIGRDMFSDYPEEAMALPDVGGGFGELNTEAIVALQPDLVLAAAITPPEQILALEKLGLVVYAIPNPVEFKELFDNIKIAGVLTGREMESQDLAGILQSRLETVKEVVLKASTRPLVFYELDVTDPNAPWTSGPGTFINTLIQTAGGENLGAALQGDWIQVSLEELIRLNPEVIVLGDYTLGGVTPEMVATRSGWEGIKAVLDQRVYTFDDDLVSRPGPRLLDGLEAMAKLLHPELFQ
jgi:iron complex transport system substrate-binding protein